MSRLAVFLGRDTVLVEERNYPTDSGARFWIESAVWVAGSGGIALLMSFSRLHILSGVGLLDNLIRGIDNIRQFLLRPSFLFPLLLSAAVHRPDGHRLFRIGDGDAPDAFIRTDIAVHVVYFFRDVAADLLSRLGRARGHRHIHARSHLNQFFRVAGTLGGIGVCVLVAAMPGGILWLLRPTMRKATSVELQRLYTSSEES